MRALVLDDWWTLTVAERPDPVLDHGEVLIKVLATGICGSDLHGYTGENGRRHPGQVMGHETVGHVVELGPGLESSTQLAVGDLVTVNPVIGCGTCARCAAGHAHACEKKTVIGVTPTRPAAFAELLAAPADNVISLPRDVPSEYGALVEPLAVGYHAVRRGRVRPGESVLVIGGGPIGQASALAAVREGARAVAVSETDADRRALNIALGVSVIDPAAGDTAQTASRLLDGPPDVVIDAVGSAATMRAALESAAAGATVVLVGMAVPDVALPAYEISTKERSVVGSFCYTPAEFRDTAAWVGTNPAELAALIDARVDLDGAPTAFEQLAKRTWNASKALVFPNGGP